MISIGFDMPYKEVNDWDGRFQQSLIAKFATHKIPKYMKYLLPRQYMHLCRILILKRCNQQLEMNAYVINDWNYPNPKNNCVQKHK
jgi:Zn-finger domain-containing protein